VIISDIKLPPVSSGDFIVVATTGAYCYSMSSNYNGQPKSAVVAVENGKSWVWIKRQTYKDLVMGDVKLYEN
jgi:diaminopimelate decarboxylase